MFSFLPLVNILLTIGLNFSLLIISEIIGYFSSLAWIVLINILTDILHIIRVSNKIFKQALSGNFQRACVKIHA